jgi:hypothetical protein
MLSDDSSTQLSPLGPVALCTVADVMTQAEQLQLRLRTAERASASGYHRTTVTVVPDHEYILVASSSSERTCCCLFVKRVTDGSAGCRLQLVSLSADAAPSHYTTAQRLEAAPEALQVPPTEGVEMLLRVVASAIWCTIAL